MECLRKGMDRESPRLKVRLRVQTWKERRLGENLVCRNVAIK